MTDKDQLPPLSGLAAWLRYMGGYAQNEGDRKACAAWAVELQAAMSSQAPVDERAAFEAWMNVEYPAVYDIGKAEHYWQHDHISALAWKARAALQSRQPAAPDIDGQALRDAVAAGFPFDLDPVHCCDRDAWAADPIGETRRAMGEARGAQPRQPAAPVAPVAADIVDEIRHLLTEAEGFAAVSPRGKENINAALDLLDTLNTVAPVAAVPQEWFHLLAEARSVAYDSEGYVMESALASAVQDIDELLQAPTPPVQADVQRAPLAAGLANKLRAIADRLPNVLDCEQPQCDLYEIAESIDAAQAEVGR